MSIVFDNRTLIFVQVIVSLTLCAVMLIAWRTQKTYPGFGRWTVSKIPHAAGWLLIGLRGVIPDWASVLVANGLLFLTAILLYEGIRQFRSRPYRDAFNYFLMALLLASFAYFTWWQPNLNARMFVLVVLSALVIARSALNLCFDVPAALRTSYFFSAAMFVLYDLVLILRLVTSVSLPLLANPFAVDAWQSVLFITTIVTPIGWTFGFFMMTNDRLNIELRTAEKELREMAATDFLTGALNRRAFIEMGQREIEHARRNGQPLALLLIDVDHFKPFNDVYGHLNGDVLLIAIVAACRASLRAVDLFVRWGGEEFAVLLPGTDLEGCQVVAEKLRCTVAGLSIPFETGSAHVTISLGGAVWLPGDETLDLALRRADVALYQAKQFGRNCVVV
jgi:diguanylate cyclase (GGDEF)-like protein